MKPFKI